MKKTYLILSYPKLEPKLKLNFMIKHKFILKLKGLAVDRKG
jgi:hypothetical protein